jgi:capsule polysaccharide export protein KpsE/RkpR
MSDNILETVQKFFQDILAPELRGLKAEVAGLRKEIDVRFTAMEERNNLQYMALLASLKELKASSELSTMRITAALAERVAVLEERGRK